jgi:toxin ParE1/3/4
MIKGSEGSEGSEGLRVCLTPEAESDLEGIWVYTAKMWSVDQANAYTDDLVATLGLLASSPFMGRERTEFVPPVRVHRHQSHLIIYRVSTQDLDIVRIAHMKQNWVPLLGE